MKWIYLALGGMGGTVLRFLTTDICHYFFGKKFPIGTLVVNLIGCFLIGFFWSLWGIKSQEANQSLRFLLIIGFCGAYTTFSTFSLDLLQLYQNKTFFYLSAYLLASVFAGIFLVWLGLKTGEFF